MFGGLMLFTMAILATVPPLVRAITELKRRTRARKRMAAGVPTLSDRALVTVTGTVRVLDATLIAPLSGTTCVAHQSRARVYAKDSRFGVRRLLDEQARDEMTSFLLSTAAGEVIVSGSAAVLAIRTSSIIPRRIDRERAFLRAVGLDDDPRNASFDQVVILEGMKLTVFGVSLVEVTPGESYYRETATRTRLTGDESHPLTIREP